MTELANCCSQVRGMRAISEFRLANLLRTFSSDRIVTLHRIFTSYLKFFLLLNFGIKKLLTDAMPIEILFFSKIKTHDDILLDLNRNNRNEQ